MQICISNVQKTTTKNDIFNIFTKKGIGLISKIDFINKIDYKIAFIKFNKFYENEIANSFLEKIKKISKYTWSMKTICFGNVLLNKK